MEPSVLLKRYVAEPESDLADRMLGADPTLAMGRHTLVEVRRTLARVFTFATFDVRLAQAAYGMGCRVVGA